jgi:hypothetical protein
MTSRLAQGEENVKWSVKYWARSKNRGYSPWRRCMARAWVRLTVVGLVSGALGAAIMAVGWG